MKSYAPVSADMAAGAAFGAVLRHNLDLLSAWRDTARTWDDIEGVHQVRVSFRRLRSAFSVFRPILGREARKFWMDGIKTLADQTNRARDIDVLIDEGLPAFRLSPQGAGLICPARFDAMMLEAREAAYADVRAMLDSAAFGVFMKDFPAWIDAQGWAQGDVPAKKRKRQGKGVVELGRRLLGKQDGAVLAFGRKADPGNAAEMHSLRIACKKLRYASEFFHPVFEDMDAYLKQMKGLQDILGLMHDAAVIRDLMGDVMPDDADAELRAYVEALAMWRAGQFEVKAASFAQEWAAFTTAERPWEDGGL